MALGCSVGQGLTGISTLALASFVAALGILLGSAAGLRGPLRVPSRQAPQGDFDLKAISDATSPAASHQNSRDVLPSA